LDGTKNNPNRMISEAGMMLTTDKVVIFLNHHLFLNCAAEV
jgi:hypothetical protein